MLATRLKRLSAGLLRTCHESFDLRRAGMARQISYDYTFV